MLFKTTTALAFLAVAATHTAAEPQSMMMSTRELFGVVRRDDASYKPTNSVCGSGYTCSEACGSGYEMCTSNDNAIHCYNPSALQTCCPDGSGDACDDGYYCAGSTAGETVCCPNGQSLAECAAAKSYSGTLTMETATSTAASSSATSSSSTEESSSVEASSTAANTTSSAEAKTTPYAMHGNSTVVTMFGTTFTTTSCSTSGVAAATGGNLTTGVLTPTASVVATSAGDVVKPAGAAVALLAAVFTLLL